MAPPKTKIFVGQLPPDCTSEELQALFERHGKVAECDVINRYGFVHMINEKDAEKAINALNRYNLRGSSLRVEASKSELHPQPGAPGRARGTPFLPPPRFGGMPPPRNEFMPPPRFGPGAGPPAMGGFGDIRNRYDFPPTGPNMDGFRERMRPYPIPYERRPMPPPPPTMREDPYAPARRTYPDDGLYEHRAGAIFERRPEPPGPPTMYPGAGGKGDYYADRAPAMGGSNSLYSRRSPPQAHDYWPDREAPSTYPPPIRRPYY